jgi:transcription antitermination factor NusG
MIKEETLTNPFKEGKKTLIHEKGFLWTPVRTKPRQEKKLAGYCSVNNIKYYLPLRKTVHRYNRRTVEFYVPMFTGYIFCCLNEDKYQSLLRSNAVVYRIQMDFPGEHSLIEELEAVQAFERIFDRKDILVKPELVQGTGVSINSGPMKGMKGVIRRRKGKTLVTVNIELLGQSVSAEADIGDVEAEES